MSGDIIHSIEKHLKTAQSFISTFDNMTNHTHGLTKSAFNDIKEKSAQYLDKALQLWNDEKSREEIVDVASKDQHLKHGNITENSLSKLSLSSLPKNASEFFTMLLNVNKMIEQLKKLLKDVMGGGVGAQTTSQVVEKVGSILKSLF